MVTGYITISGETYATGGITMAASSFGLSEIHTVMFSDNSALYCPYYDITNGKIVLYQLRNTNEDAASTQDTFYVLDSDNAADEELVKVRSGGSGFGMFGVGVDGLGTEGFVFAKDSSTVLAIMDSSFCEDFGDTVFYDEDGLLYRLYHNASVTGYKHDYMIPYNYGRDIIRVRYASNASSLGVPLYFDHDQSEKDEKFTAASPTNANGGFFVVTEYAMLSWDDPVSYEVSDGTSLITTTLRFVAFGL